MNYGFSLKTKLLLFFILVALIVVSITGYWKLGVGVVLICMSFLFSSIHKRQKQATELKNR